MNARAAPTARRLDDRAAAIREAAHALAARLPSVPLPPDPSGEVVGCEGPLLSVRGLDAPVGTLVSVRGPDCEVLAEVIGFREGALLLAALAPGAVAPGARAIVLGRVDRVAVGRGLLGRVTDAMGAPVDGFGPMLAPGSIPLSGRPLPPLARLDVTEAIATGVRAIDGLFTLGRGQRIGLVAGSGVGKSTLLLQLARGVAADMTVVALIGERGREIAGFVGSLEDRARARCHVIAVPADHAAPLRVRGALRALAVAEAFRAEGAHVLLLVDSLTRVAHAQRQIGLAAGEPAGVRGYPASALALLPALVERAGNDGRTGGAITAIFTVLADGDDVVSDPVVDAARGVLDGQILLSRALAARGRLPAIDTGQSISRTMAACVPPDQLAAARAFLRDASLLESARDLIAMGAYAPGADPALDAARAREAGIEAFLRQPPEEQAAFAETVARLARLMREQPA
jgi:flagellum-specific ATP synthase